MPPEEIPAQDTSSPATESPSPAIESPAETPPSEQASSTPEPVPAPVEAVPAPETDQPATQTAQVPSNEPILPESESIKNALEPPSSAALAQTGIMHSARDLLVKARVALQDRKRKKRDKIMEALTKKNRITNDEVEKLLHVSDATAERYLSALVKEGKIKQEKKTGAGVAYTKI